MDKMDDYLKEQKSKNRGLVAFRKKNPERVQKFMDFWRSVNKGGPIPSKYVELMELAFVLSMQCRDCIIKHTRYCILAGCTEEEMMHAASIALSMGGAVVYEYIGYMMESFSYFNKEKEEV